MTSHGPRDGSLALDSSGRDGRQGRATASGGPDTGPGRRPGRTGRLRGLVPGLAVCAVAAALAIGISSLAPALSPLLVAIILGAVLVNVWRLPGSWQPGLAFSSRTLLRAGIALLGLQLLLSDILDLGWGVIATVVAVVCIGIVSTLVIGSMLGISPAQRLLIACGFSICGAAAVAAADGVAEAEEEETVTAVALVVLFGTLMIPVIPLLSAALGLGPVDSGVWAGASIHEVAQVVAAGSALGGTALGVAVVVKLARVLLLAPVIIGIGISMRRRATDTPDQTRPPLVPLFIIAFLACVGLRSVGVVPEVVLDVAKVAQTALLAAAMFGLGTGVRFATLRAVGPRPFVLAAIATVIVTGVALVGVQLL
ncbi:YeiH family protein [Dietzia aurantiaca]|uniref:YeiH family protein n=1 Tax=Dietzia aurantiaca TaxID=983873 RepID=A0ABV9PU20_9ACTN